MNIHAFVGKPFYPNADTIQHIIEESGRTMLVREEHDVVIDSDPNRVNVWIEIIPDGLITRITYG